MQQQPGRARSSAARPQVTADRPAAGTDSAASAHLPGLTPEAATLRVLLAAAGIVAPHTNEPWTEAMLLGVTGGVGLSVFAFRYDKQDVSTFYVGARRADTAGATTSGLDRLGITHDVLETTGARTAERHLRTKLEGSGPVAAWVDAATLGTRGMPAWWEGGMYHVLAVLAFDDAAGTATLSDLATPPVVVDQRTLAGARARIRKQRHRLLAITGPQPATLDLRDLVRSSIGACHANPTAQRTRSFTLAALDEAADRYDELGRQWADLARAALPDDVEALAQARRLHDDKARLYAEQGAAAKDELASLWRQLDNLAGQAAEQFPLDRDGAAALRRPRPPHPHDRGWRASSGRGAQTDRCLVKGWSGARSARADLAAAPVLGEEPPHLG